MQSDPRVLLADIDQVGADIEFFIEGMDTEAYATNVLLEVAAGQ